MAVPYGLNVIESCIICKLREDRLFCNLYGRWGLPLKRLPNSGAVIASPKVTFPPITPNCNGSLSPASSAATLVASPVSHHHPRFLLSVPPE
jgi:hypothetical protein